MFKKILIANRGEIACRIARTARKMGIATVAVYSDADTHAQHVEECDEAIHIGPAQANQSYLCIEKIIEAAETTGAEAIHPGYGFLSENATFAERCFTRNIKFIGPSADAIRSMGSKSRARQIVAAANVPVLPGYDNDNQDTQVLVQAAETVGYPLLIKAVSGGGGKGMRVVNQSDNLLISLAAVKRESQGAFGDDHVLLERYLPTARHIEIQIFADTHGNVVHLFERDCSMQRRHQKVIEEAPAPMMTNSLRLKMGQAAVECAKAISYEGAGTIEFLLAPDDQFYFMEMNTRLQVEHPVTELITGQDLVEWQLRVAHGAQLPLTQSSLSIHGHAFEARVYAENPALGFLPATGTLHYMSLPDCSSNTRVDTGVRQGDEVSVHYDPMIAKLIVWGEDRPAALRRLHTALDQYQILGVQNNIAFLGQLSTHPLFEKGQTDTRFIESHFSELSSLGKGTKETTPYDIGILAACYDQLKSKEATQKKQQQSQDPYSPWGICDDWQNQLHGSSHLQYQVSDTVNTSTLQIQGSWRQKSLQLSINSNSSGISVNLPADTPIESKIFCEARLISDNHMIVILGNRRLSATMVDTGSVLLVCYRGHNWQIQRLDPRSQENDSSTQDGQLTAPMPGTVVAVMVQEGDDVSKGDPLMIVEAMKMEHQINAPINGTVGGVYFVKGEQVSEGDTLLTLDELI
ncbi:MAG: acetyl-CoA carboxylase biotin carboxylase subunit [Gammaproteobacteria bacterium]|nr:acetyl-CoA carboxylase biotin carboxylase subunit [Gammaproteobacteria bacterium]